MVSTQRSSSLMLYVSRWRTEFKRLPVWPKRFAEALKCGRVFYRPQVHAAQFISLDWTSLQTSWMANSGTDAAPDITKVLELYQLASSVVQSRSICNSEASGSIIGVALWCSSLIWKYTDALHCIPGCLGINSYSWLEIETCVSENSKHYKSCVNKTTIS